MKKLARLFAQGQKFRRVHGIVLVGDAEVDVIAHGGLQQRGAAYTADGLSRFHLITHADGHILGKTGILGHIAAVVADHHGMAQGIVLVDGILRAVSGGADGTAGFRGDVNAVVDPPVPGGLVVAGNPWRIP